MMACSYDLNLYIFRNIEKSNFSPIVSISAMSLSDQFCVERHKKHFLELVQNKLDIIFANEQEIMSLINVKKFDDIMIDQNHISITPLM